jgi:DNA replicative helicase MCM subunit Mcm2 (Cdc46/Mcm family)
LPELPDDKELEDLFAANYVHVLANNYEFLIDGRYNRTVMFLARVRARLLMKQYADREDLQKAIEFVNKCKNIETTDPKTGKRDGNFLVGALSKDELSQEDLNKKTQWVTGCKVAMRGKEDGYFTEAELRNALASIEGSRWTDSENVHVTLKQAVEAGAMKEKQGRYTWLGG